MRKSRCLSGWAWLVPAACLSACAVSSTGDTEPDRITPGDDEGLDGGGGSGPADAGAPERFAGAAPVAGAGREGKAFSNDPPNAGGDGGGGAGGAPAADACPGESHSLTAGTPLTIEGTLADAIDHYTTFCADTSSTADRADVVYQLVVASEMTVTFQITTASFNPALSLRRKDCSTEQNGDACINAGATSEQMKTALVAGTYWLVVDSANGAAGAFTLGITPAAPACGDGVLNTGETCDPGGAAANDGCHDPGDAAECTLGEVPSSSDATQCPGLGISVSAANDYANRLIEGPYHNGAGGDVQENDTTEDLAICGWPAAGPENVFHVTPTSTGTLHARIGHDGSGQVMCDLNPLCGDFILYVRQTQCEPIDPPEPLQQADCDDFGVGFQEILEVTVPVTASEDYWVFVDGYDDTWGLGPFWLELWME